MPEEVLFETETVQRRDEVAAYLRQVADSLEDGGELSLSAGDQSITMAPPDQFTFEIKAEREGPAEGPGELSLEFELEWDENGGAGGELSID